MSNGVNEYILRKKRIKLIKKVSIISVFIIAIFLFILIKSSFFNVKKIEVKNNAIVKKENIVDYKTILGHNIFLVNLNDIKKQVLRNPYIKSVKVERKFPNEIVINVEERKATFTITESNKYYILNEDLIIMEEKNNIEGLILPQVDGLNIDSRFVGESITKEQRRKDALKEIATALKKEDDCKFSTIDISDIRNIVLYKDSIKIILGNDEYLQDKIAKALKILKSDYGNIEKGYIDVSFNGNPVIYNEKDTKISSNNEEGN